MHENMGKNFIPEALNPQGCRYCGPVVSAGQTSFQAAQLNDVINNVDKVHCRPNY